MHLLVILLLLRGFDRFNSDDRWALFRSIKGTFEVSLVHGVSYISSISNRTFICITSAILPFSSLIVITLSHIGVLILSFFLLLSSDLSLWVLA